MPKLKKVTVRNKLDDRLSEVKVLYAQSNKSTSVFGYATNWKKVNVEDPKCSLITDREEVSLGDIPFEKEATVECEIPFGMGVRGYWQVYFRYRGKSYKINKNNAQVNPWYPEDDGQYVEITIRYEEGEKIRLDFVMRSGNAYFYATSHWIAIETPRDGVQTVFTSARIVIETFCFDRTGKYVASSNESESWSKFGHTLRPQGSPNTSFLFDLVVYSESETDVEHLFCGLSQSCFL